MSVMGMAEVANRSKTATIEVLGEGIRAKVPLPAERTSVRDVLVRAGVPVHEDGWDLFVDGSRRSSDHVLEGTRDATITYAPRTRGA